ncbi:MAG: right-handed parallel beta-helix repeat-containing protein, partial [Sodaliphilus sp.]|nr:right-handed parallel beta-helix repeat-containing protein [Sodaliphilus sp.]
ELATKLATDGAVVKLAPNTTYSLPATVGDEIEIIGNEGAKIEVPAAVQWHGKTATFHNVKLVYGQSDNVGIQHANTVNYENCEIEGKMFSYAANSEFVSCVFTQNAVDYNIWTYGSQNIKFTNCTFNCKGKAALLYNEGAVVAQTATFENCTFNASAPAAGKAAIEIDSNASSYDVYINNCVATGFDLGNVSRNSLWNQKLGNKTNLWVDGVQKLTRE